SRPSAPPRSCATREGARAAGLAGGGADRGRGDRLDRPRSARAARRRPRRLAGRRGRARRAGPRAADLRRRRGQDERAAWRARGALRQPVHALCGHAARQQAELRRGSPARAGGGALFAILRPAPGRAWALRRAHGGRADERRARHDPPGSNLKPMPTPANPAAAAVAVGGIDLGGTKIEAIVTDATYKVLGGARHPTPTTGGPADVANAMAAALTEAAKAASLEPSRRRGVGVGSPGTVDAAAGTVSRADNLPGWYASFPLAAALQSALGT